MTPDLSDTAFNLQSALEWLDQIVDGSLSAYIGGSNTAETATLSYYDDDSWLSRFLRQYKPEPKEFAVFVLALVPHLKPGLIGRRISTRLPEGGDFHEFGGVRVQGHRDILPTGETAQFVLAGNDLEKRLAIQRLFSTDHWFAQNHILWLEPVREGEPVMSGRIIIAPEIVEEITLGQVTRPRFGADFPAEYLETAMDWDDLVLHPGTLDQVREIEHWIQHNDTLVNDWGMGKRIKLGYRALFYGPPGTGKTLTATLLGKHTGKDVFRIDLSRVVSKYIGETEKTGRGCSTRRRTRTGSCSSTKPTPCSANAPTSATRTTNMPTRKSPTCCNGSRTTTAW
jgi:hypothetical protein